MKIKYRVGILALFAVVCMVFGYLVAPKGSPIIIPAEAKIYTDDEATELFLDDMQWRMPDLLQHEVYLVDTEMNIDFWFAKSADFAQIDGARSFAITSIVLKRPHSLGISPYQSLIIDMSINWKTVSCKVYQGRKLLYHDRYDENLQLVK